jgi:CBS domain containing-hemolysin-like protein
MELFFDININFIYQLLLLLLLGMLLSIADFSLSMFRLNNHENEIKNVSFIEKLCFKISTNYENYSLTYYILQTIILVLGIIILYNILLNFQFINNPLFDNDLTGNPSTKETVILRFILISAVIFYLFFIFKLTPKLIQINISNFLAKILSVPFHTLHLILTPIRFPLMIMDKLLDSLNKNFNANSHLSSEEEIREIIEESSRAGNIEEDEGILLENIFEFKDTVVRQVMTPRKNIISIGENWTEAEIFETITSEGYSRYPVYSGNIDNVIGILNAKDIVNLIIKNKSIIPKELIRESIFIKEDKKIDELLREFQKSKIQMAIVLDDFGGTSGIITMEDILEEIVGEIHDEHDEVDKILDSISENVFIADATANIRDLNNLLPENLPESEDYESLGGLIINETEIIPEVNTEIEISNYKFVILKRSSTKLEKIKLIFTGTKIQ